MNVAIVTMGHANFGLDSSIIEIRGNKGSLKTM